MYDFDGNVLGTVQFGDGLNDSVRGIVAVPSGFYVAGTKSGGALNQQTMGDNDAFVMKVIAPPVVSKGGVLNAASFATPAPLAPGSLAVVFGAYLNDGPQVLSPNTDAAGNVGTSLGGTRVLVNNIPAPILYSTTSQVAIQIPYELAGQAVALVLVEVGGQFSAGLPIAIAPAAPGIFTQNQAGTGPAVVIHQDGVTLVTPQNPAQRNEVVTLYTTGLGTLDPTLGTGAPPGVSLATETVSLAFGTANGAILYAGGAPPYVGLNQINVKVPATAPIASDVPISLTVGGRTANASTVAIGQ